jgi:GTP-binding protein LepA
MNGTLTTGSRLRYIQVNATRDAEEIGVRLPEPTPVASLGPGEVGYLIAGIKDVGEARSGETVTTASHGATEALEGYRDPKPMVFCGIFPIDGDEFENLREALEKMKLNDASFTYEPESSGALGFGFRCGFLGLLHMEITRDRLEREFGLELISTAPNVVYRVVMEDGAEVIVTNPSYWPEGKVREVYEPVAKCTVIAPSEYVGAIMELCQSRRGELGGMDYLSETRVELRYELPMGEIMFDFFDALKSAPRVMPASITRRQVSSRPTW